MWILTVVIAWLVLLLFWGGFWRADQRLKSSPEPEIWPDVVIVIPARDEADTIAEVVRAHQRTDYPGSAYVIVVDDCSSDDTASLAREAGADVVRAAPLEPGWSGKLWALNSGLQHADRTRPDAEWVLLTDADILHASATLRALVAKGLAKGLSMVSLMARLDTRGSWAGLLIPAFVFFFQKLYPFPWVNRPGHWCAAAAGGCVLVRRKVLGTIGGIAGIRSALIDDCTLAAKIKHTPPGRSIWLGLADHEAVSWRDNQSFGSIWTMVTRTAFTQLHHSSWLLVGAVAGMVFLYLTPPFLALWGSATRDLAMTACGFAAWGLMAVAFAPTARLYGQLPWRGLLLPLAAGIYASMTVGSAIAHWRGRGGQWKGRTYG
ncbi:MAG: glycosyltransferase [Paracoccaceae bacterium]